MKIYKVFLVIVAILVALNCFSLWRISNRDELIKDKPIKEATLIEKREIPTRYGHMKVFHVIWTKHPSRQNLHDEIEADVNDYYKLNIGAKLTYPFTDFDYPENLQYRGLFILILTFIFSGLIFFALWATDS